MYTVILLRDGKKKYLKEFYNLFDFKCRYGNIKHTVVGYIIYVHEKLAK